ncbi:MAG: hypothetical protein M1825_006162 [Sarcosagium campestre]|nr:MAG: hypothetical protein M1825_006162 [Sarcosagium campestre]
MLRHIEKRLPPKVPSLRLTCASATSEFPEETQRPAYETGDQNAAQGSGQSQNRIRRPLAAERTPTKGVYVGNLFFSVTEQDLEREFQQFGKISNVRVIYDQKGLSKGLGFVEFENVESATEAVKTMDGVVLQGRPLYVQYTLKPQRNTIRPNTVMNPPGRTLFIGNLSFEMSDKDLQDLFQDVDGVENVRVAVDRRTGQPRGFCHVDFWDTEKATAGMDVLQGRQIFGRTIRLDYSTSPSRPSRNSPIETES